MGDRSSFDLAGVTYVLQVVGAERQAQSVRIRYVVTPSFPLDGSVGLATEAVDEHGREYDDAGGAYGVPPGADCTEGALTLVPRPPADTARLDLTLSLLHRSSDERDLRIPIALA